MPDLTPEDLRALHDAGYEELPPLPPCSNCESPAKWIRLGIGERSDLFCDWHARLEEDFDEFALGFDSFRWHPLDQIGFY